MDTGGMSVIMRTQTSQITVPEAAAPEPVATIQKLKTAHESLMLVGPMMEPIAVEQYRRLAAVLHHAQTQSGIRSVMIASAVPGEGKTLTSVNLALTLSQSFRKRVVLVDADLRRPTVHEVLQVPNVAGLNEGLKAQGA